MLNKATVSSSNYINSCHSWKNIQDSIGSCYFFSMWDSQYHNISIYCQIDLRWMPQDLTSTISQYWFRQWLGAVLQQVITWTNVDTDLCPHRVTRSQSVNSLAPARYSSKFKSMIFKYIIPKSTLKLPSAEYHRTPLMRRQHWFRKWLGATRQQAISWANVDADLCHQMSSLGHN